MGSPLGFPRPLLSLLWLLHCFSFLPPPPPVKGPKCSVLWLFRCHFYISALSSPWSHSLLDFSYLLLNLDPNVYLVFIPKCLFSEHLYLDFPLYIKFCFISHHSHNLQDKRPWNYFQCLSLLSFLCSSISEQLPRISINSAPTLSFTVNVRMTTFIYALVLLISTISYS